MVPGPSAVSKSTVHVAVRLSHEKRVTRCPNRILSVTPNRAADCSTYALIEAPSASTFSPVHGRIR